MEKLTKSFEHAKKEKEIYAFWESKGFFNADPDSKKEPFSIVIPPPNITGSLHIGHALDNTLQDIFVRYKRMSGYNTLWMPGTDHAGIATQNVVEKQLHAEGKTRQEVGRQAFLERVWRWKEEYGSRIINQLKRLGCSCDWPRERFTMDEGLSKAVRKVFVDLYLEGLIYRDNYIINWCPRCLTALSDLEVEQKETKGKLYYIRYPFEGAKDHLTVATTRPETMLGDTAVAVNPKDKRFKKYIGKYLVLPLANRKIPVIADDKVDIDFGTGALKITPAHDFNDFEVSKAHRLERINIFTEDGHLNENAGTYKGLEIRKAREKVLDDLKTQGLLEKADDYKLIIGNCYRCKTTVEPRMSMQWFVKVASLAKRAKEAVKAQKTRIIPKGWEATYFDWMDNIRDWCISRQLWWGHRIPAWYCQDCREVLVSTDDPNVCTRCSGSKLTQDPDVLDTWFSSSLWPFSTMGWPEDTPLLRKFYPTSLLITGFDIIFFWVARMMMMGLKCMGDVPFRDVFIHALVRDEYGQKMSKSKGNVVDPLEIMERFGTDAFRFTLAILTVQGRDISISEKRIIGYRNFINKIWNAARFVFNGMGEEPPSIGSIDSLKLSTIDRWARTKLNTTIAQVRKDIDSYKFNEAASTLYRFVWNEFCDWYIEFSKRAVYKGSEEEKRASTTSLLYTLDRTLKLLHPFIPFVTEEIWKAAPKSPFDPESIMISAYPADDGFKDEDAFFKIEFLKEMISSIRTIRMENLISPQKKLEVIFIARDKKKTGILEESKELVMDLAGVDRISFNAAPPRLCAKTLASGIEIVVPIEGLIDVKPEIARLTKEIAKSDADVEFFEKRLANEGYIQKAAEDLIEQDRESLAQAREKLSKLKESLKRLKEFDS